MCLHTSISYRILTVWPDSRQARQNIPGVSLDESAARAQHPHLELRNSLGMAQAKVMTSRWQRTAMSDNEGMPGNQPEGGIFAGRPPSWRAERGTRILLKVLPFSKARTTLSRRCTMMDIILFGMENSISSVGIVTREETNWHGRCPILGAGGAGK